MRVVAVEDGDPARFKPEKDFGLGVGDFFDRTEKAEMSGFDRRDDGDVRPHQPGQCGDFARMVHAEFEHAIRPHRAATGPATAALPNGY